MNKQLQEAVDALAVLAQHATFNLLTPKAIDLEATVLKALTPPADEIDPVVEKANQFIDEHNTSTNECNLNLSDEEREKALKWFTDFVLPALNDTPNDLGCAKTIIQALQCQSGWMPLSDALKQLAEYQDWRKGADIEQPHPKDISSAINQILEYHDQPPKESKLC